MDRLSVIASGFADVRDLPSLAGKVNEALQDMVAPQALTGLYLWDADRLRLFAARGFTDDERLEAERTAWDRHPGAVFRSQQMLHVRDTRTDEERRSQSSRRSFEVRSRLYLPVTFQGTSVGVFGVASLVPDAFDARTVALLRFMCQLTGVLYGQVMDRLARERALAQLRELNLQLAEAHDAALVATRAKSRFLANMSHELRTPLNAIIGYGELVLDELDGPAAGARADLSRILTSARDLLRLINDVLDLAKVEAGRLTLRVEAVVVEDLIEEMSRTLHPEVEANGNELVWSSSLPPDARVWTDGSALKRVLLNLVGNANKFTSEGWIDVTLWQEGTGSRRTVHVTVCDTGVGMTDGELARVFRAFTQADSSMSRKYGGTGLGLTITRELLGLMGGGVSATSEIAVGSCFHAWFCADRRG
ncbi:MAG: GAF domain-containing protein [Myxococcales bacterium]|nr:GAF domain-containing protein [Myxococcales bacterium]